MTTATLTLTDFILARIAEDEATAQAASVRRTTWATAADTAASVAGADSGLFILFTPPEKVLAECEAKRQIVEHHHHDGDRCLICNWESASGRCPTIRHLAAVYAGHPDYHTEWSA